MYSHFKFIFALATVFLLPLTVSTQAQSVRQVPLAAVNSLPSNSPIAADNGQGPELDSALTGNDADGSDSDAGGPGIAINRTISTGPGSPMSHGGNGKAKSNPELVASIDGLDHYDQRFGAANGNQFSIEPPDQGLCVGNGFVLETVNDVLRIYDTAGNPLTGPIDLNSFYGYAPAIDRDPKKPRLQFGPSITDPSCTFDTQTQRWFHVVLTLDRANIFTQNLSGANHLDIAVSATSSPLGSWNVYRLPVQDDGTQGTPDHHCTLGRNPAHGPCLGDYPPWGPTPTAFMSRPTSSTWFHPAFTERKSTHSRKRSWRRARLL